MNRILLRWLEALAAFKGLPADLAGRAEKRLRAWVVGALLALAGAGVQAQAPEAGATQILFQNVNVFDGRSEQLALAQEVLIEGNLIKAIGKGLEADGAGQVIDGGGRTLMPGLIDSHVHFSVYMPASKAARSDVNPFKAAAVATARAERMLLRGFTTVRDTGGQSAFLRQTTEAGITKGPRIYGTGAMLSQTSGHGDFRALNDRHPNMNGGPVHWYERYISIIADGPDEVRRGAREVLREGGLFLKIFTSGGVSSEFDPLHMEQYTPDEVRAAVQVADQWKTYVTTHAFTDHAVRMAVDNGVKMVEHVPFISEDTVQYLKRKDIFVEVNVSTVLGRSLDELRQMLTPASFEKVQFAIDNMIEALKFLAKHDAKMIYGSDLVAPWETSLAVEERLQLGEFEILSRYFRPIQVLRAATGHGGDLAALTGPNNPWQEGPLGVVEEGAYADLLLVDGNPLQDLSVMSDGDNNFRIIMKDGVIYKNSLPPAEA